MHGHHGANQHKIEQNTICTWPARGRVVLCSASAPKTLTSKRRRLSWISWYKSYMKKDRPNWFRLSPCSFLPWYPHPLSLALHNATTKVWWGTVAPRHFQMDQVFSKKCGQVCWTRWTGEGKSNWCNFSTTTTKSVILLCQCKIHVTFSTKINYAYLVAGGCAWHS